MALKKIFTIIFILGLFMTLKSQVIDDQQTLTSSSSTQIKNDLNYWKITGGYAVSYLTEVWEGYKYNHKIHAGISYSYPMIDMLKNETGIRYIIKGYRAEYRFYDGDVDKVWVDYHYIDLFNKFKLNNPSLPFEPYIGISGALLFYNYLKIDSIMFSNINEGYFFWEDSKHEDYLFEEKIFDMNILLGADYNINQRFSIGVEINLGVIGLQNDIYYNKNRSLLFSVGYRF